MMLEVKLPSERSTTRLGFGCSGLVAVPVPVAPSSRLGSTPASDISTLRRPSHGLPEDVLGDALRSCRDAVTITTKVGIGRRSHSNARSLVRAVVKPTIALPRSGSPPQDA
jgi:hypothetical protein